MLAGKLILFESMLYITVNNYSVMLILGSFTGLDQYKAMGIKTHHPRRQLDSHARRNAVV